MRRPRTTNAVGVLCCTGDDFSSVKQPGVEQEILFYKPTRFNAIVLNISTFELLASLFTSTLQRGVCILF